jgi:hypothetical protein
MAAISTDTRIGRPGSFDCCRACASEAKGRDRRVMYMGQQGVCCGFVYSISKTWRTRITYGLGIA